MPRLTLFALFSCCVLLSSRLPASAWAQPQPASTVQLPTFGVAIDADGVLTLKTFTDPGGELRLKRLTAAKVELPANVLAWSEMRKVSLVKLERAMQKKLAAGERLDDTMRYLAGLQQARYVFFYPDRRDIVIAGPAEGWWVDPSGRIVGIGTGRPVVELADLIVALRAYPPGTRHKPFIGCTIDPDPEGLARLQKFQQTVPQRIPQAEREQAAMRIAAGVRQSLGMANVRVFGVSDKTHFAQVLIEADYRMKLIGLGLEPPPVRMTTFLEALDGPKHSTLQRWWFTPNYECVKATDDRLAMELVGQGVQLLGEDKVIGPDGGLIGSAPSGRASELFTASFTRKYPDIAARSPVYAQLRNMIDLVIAAAFIREQDYYGRAGWTLGVLDDEVAFPIETLANPKRVACAVNSLWKGGRLLTPAGGGVSIQSDLALDEKKWLADQDGQLTKQFQNARGRVEDDRWWWD